MIKKKNTPRINIRNLSRNFNVIYRYYFLSLIPIFITSFLILTGIFLLDKLFLAIDLLIRKGIPFLKIMEFLLYTAPAIAATSIPVSLLVATIIIFGKAGENREHIILLSSGLPLYKILLSLFLPFLLTFCFMLFFNAYILPRSNLEWRKILYSIYSKKPSARIEPGEFIEDFKGYTLYVEQMNSKTNEIFNIMLYNKTRAEVPTMVTAEKGKIISYADKNKMMLELYNADIHEAIDSSYRWIKSDTFTVLLTISNEMKNYKLQPSRESEFTFRQLLHKLQEFKKTNVPPKILKIRTNRVRHELLKKISLSLLVLIFLLLGPSIGLIIKKSNIGFGYVISLILFSIYYLLAAAFENLGYQAKVDASISAFAPILILFIPTVYLFWRVFVRNKI